MAIDRYEGTAPHLAELLQPGHRTFIEALGVAVYATDANGVITDYNEAAVELWGRRPELGKDEWCGSWRLYWPNGTAMAHSECPMATALKENRAVRGEEAIAERPDGTRVCFIPYPTPLRDGTGALIGAVNVLVDITDRKRAERSLEENEARLTQAIAAKDEFLGLISHELRTPITTILGNAEVLARNGGGLDADLRLSALNDIQQEALRLNWIVDDLLTLARLEGGHLECEPHAIGRVVPALVERYRERSRRQINFVGVVEPLVAMGDERMVGHILRNYLSNAEKYSGAGSVIEVIVERGESEAVIRVLDRGVGIRPDEVDRLFEPFYRSSDVNQTSGVGIGLSVCVRLADAMGGRVWAAPRVGGGSEFGFALPLCDDHQEPD